MAPKTKANPSEIRRRDEIFMRIKKRSGEAVAMLSPGKGPPHLLQHGGHGFHGVAAGFVLEPEVALVVDRAQHPGDAGHVDGFARPPLRGDLRFEMYVDGVGCEFLEVAVNVVRGEK